MKPWEEHPNIWKTESAWLSYVRGGIRRGLWEKYPPKLAFLNSRVQLKENTNPRSMKRFPLVKMWQCEQCEEWFKSNMVECDHRSGHNSFKSIDELVSYVKAMLLDCSFSDYAVLCKPCHKIKSYSDAQGISLEEARLEKAVIEICKLKASEQDKWLAERNISCAKNKDSRRNAIRECLKEEMKDAQNSNRS